MAAHIKKRALAEFTQVIQEEVAEPKRLRLTHKPKPPEVLLSFENATTPQHIINIILKFEDSFPIDTDSAPQVLRILQEQFALSTDNVVRSKIASTLRLLVRMPSIDRQQLVNDTTRWLKTEESHKVQSQLLHLLCVCGQVSLLNQSLHEQIIQVATQYLNSSSHLVRVKCLEILGALGRTESPTGKPGTSQEGMKPVVKQAESGLLAVVVGFIDDPDSRVRAAVLQTLLQWQERGVRLQQWLYERVCKAVDDDFESVRLAAIKLIWVLVQLFPDGQVKIEDSDEENRLIDDGFARICDMINDNSMRVRAEAARLLGSLHGVSEKFLEQTLDKKLMSNMRHKKAANERQRELFEGGGWASGRKWADDAPGGDVDEASVTLMSMGACGAFVHGLEDEFMEVRNASIDSVGELATRSEQFALLCQDSLVDMFNDELEAVRLNAIHSLRKLAQHVTLREDQSEIILACLKDFSYEIREALRLLFCSVKLATQNCLASCIFGLLDNLRRYPQDRTDIYRTMQQLGEKHSYFSLPMVPDLLSAHPYFESVEADVDDPAYVAILILVFNAGVNCPSIPSLLPSHVSRHYRYLRDSHPDLVPAIRMSGESLRLKSSSSAQSLVPAATSASPASFLQDTLITLQGLTSLSMSDSSELMRRSVDDLNRVAQMDRGLAPVAGFMASYLQCHSLLCKVMLKTPTQLVQTNSFALLKKVVELSHELEEKFVGLAVKGTSDVMQLRLVAQSLQLLELLTANAPSVKQSCVQYLQLLNSFERFLADNKLEAGAVCRPFLLEMTRLESCDPAVFYSVLSAALLHYRPHVLTLQHSLRQAKATIAELTGDSDRLVKFVSGLVVSVDLIATLENIDCIHDIRIMVKYADQQVHTVLPRAKDFKQLTESKHRLVTKVLLSHSQWSEPCGVEISLVKVYQRDREFSHEKQPTRYDLHVESHVPLCTPVTVNVAPKSSKL